jgi:hypothetical protein
MTTTPEKATTPAQGAIQGEGDYASARKFDAEQRSFAESGQVEKKAREAEQALDGPEGPALEAARKAAAEGHSVKSGDHRAGHPDHVAVNHDPHTEDALDNGLEESFPASDPVSISPGAD